MTEVLIMLSAYPACFIKEDTGYSVIFPDLNTATCGDDLEDAFSMAVDCLAGYLYSSNLEGENVPPASGLQDIDIQKIMDEQEVGILFPKVNAYSYFLFIKLW